MFPTQCGSMYQEAGAELWIWGKKKKKSTSIEFLKKLQMTKAINELSDTSLSLFYFLKVSVIFVLAH